MNPFEKGLAEYIGLDNLKKIQTVKIGIAGAGGLGSNCAFNLVRSGFKRILIVDFDRVEYSNLNRQFYFIDQVGLPKTTALYNNLKRINPDLQLTVVTQKIKKDNIEKIFRDCDIVVEALDDAEYKSMLVEKMLPSGKLIISVSGIAGWGKSDDIRVHRIKPNLIIIGDLHSEVNTRTPPLSPRVNIAAAKQADVILEYVLDVLGGKSDETAQANRCQC